MHDHVIQVNAILWILFQQRPDQILCLARQIHWHLELAQHDLIKRIANAFCVEWWFAGQKRVQHTTKRPHVGFETMCTARCYLTENFLKK